MITSVAEKDLRRLVGKLRKAASDRAEIPKHSGAADSATRKERRQKRAQLSQTIHEAERAIVSWALVQCPPEMIREVDDEG